MSMKKFVSILVLILSLSCLFGCSSNNNKESTTITHPSEKTSEKYEGSKFLGNWYNTYSTNDVADFQLNADGTALYKGETKGTWEELNEEILVRLTIDGEAREIKGYFVIAGDGFVARATPENQHYLDEDMGQLQLEFMLTENTCIDCIKK